MNNQIIIALERRLKALAPTFPTAWDNKDFAVPTGPFQAPQHLFAEPDDRGMKDSPYLQRGILTVVLAYPTNQGSGPANLKAKEIKDWFKRATTMVADAGFSVIVERTPEITGGSVEDGRYIVRVRIRWYAYIDPS